MNGKPVIKTLAVMDSEGKHTAQATVEMVKQTMARYELTMEQLLAIVTDNASSMVKTLQLLNDVDREVEVEDQEVEEQDEDPENEENDDLRGLIVDARPGASATSSTDDTVYMMRCAAHTLQLAIRDGLKLRGALPVLVKVRAMAKKLRAPNMVSSLKKKGALLPIIDVETRWGSSYKMLRRILELKNYIEDYAAAAPELHIGEDMWTKVQKLADVLELPYAVTVRLQSSSLTAGTFMKEWVMLKKSLLEKGEVGAAIANSMVRRQEKLFDSDALLAAVFADARYRILITDDFMDRAERAFAAIMERVQRIYGSQLTSEEKRSTSSEV